MKGEDRCNNNLLEVARRAVNGALNLTLRGKDPLNTTLHAGNYDINLWGCNAGLEIDATARVGGFEGMHIQSLECAEEEGDAVTLTGRLTFGPDIDMDAKVAAQWSLCGLDLGPGENNVTMGAHSGDPGLTVRVYLKKTRVPFIWRIAQIKAWETDVGNLDRFTCGLSGVPDFIGSKFEQWCVGIISWLAEKLQDHLMGDVDEIFKGLMNDLLDALPF